MKPLFRDPISGKILDTVELIDNDTGNKLGDLEPESGLEGLRRRNLTMDTDLYELTMVAGYHVLGKEKQQACFDLYFRKNPDNGAFCICAGLESVIDYVKNLGIYPDDIEYLRSLGIFSKEALEYLRSGIKFTGDIWAVPEGTIVFPNEPLVRVIGPITEAQILETTLLALMGHQTLIATKAARLCLAARGAPVVDFGTRRAHGVQAALYGARAAYIGGCTGSSNVRAGKLFGVPVKGTHAHSWVESFDDELEAFQGYSKAYPDNCVLLVDTYDTLEGVRQAIQVAKEMRSKGKEILGIRIDSGDLSYYSKAARVMLNHAGLSDVKILASSDLDEWLIQSMRDQGAAIDIWCVGTRLITSYQTPALGVVYKLMAVDHGDGKLFPKIKISQNPEKVTNPGVKQIVRFYNGNENMIGDMLIDEDEPLPSGELVVARHPMYDYMRKIYKPPYTAKKLLVPIFEKGKLVYDPPNVEAIRRHTAEEINRLEPEYKRITNPHIYKVSLSEKVHRTKKALLDFHHDKNHHTKH